MFCRSACVMPEGSWRNVRRDRQVELAKCQRHLVELGVGGGRRVEEEREDVVVGDGLRSARDHLEDALCIDHGSVWDRRHPHYGLRLSRVAGLGYQRPDAGFDVQPRGRVPGLVDLLHVGDAVHVDVGHVQPAVRDVPVDPREHELVIGEVQFEEAIVPRCQRVRTPDCIEAMADPGAGGVPRAREFGERTEWIPGLRHRCSGVSRPAENKVGIEL